MSLIGPRPEDSCFVDLHKEAFERILTVRPGITGWTQLLFVDERRLIDSDDAVGCYIDRLLPRKVELDLLYASNRRLGHDFKLLLWTPLVLLFRCEIVFVREAREFRLIRPGGNGSVHIPLTDDGVGGSNVRVSPVPSHSE
jgi:lipopolysaccharide/colanic/teichoic acid biosynthesis glycosyltransferase